VNKAASYISLYIDKLLIRLAIWGADKLKHSSAVFGVINPFRMPLNSQNHVFAIILQSFDAAIVCKGNRLQTLAKVSRVYSLMMI
jgi:hypothetical protein